MKKRIISGVVLAPFVVALIILGGWFFTAMIVAAALVSLYEFIGLVNQGKYYYFNLLVAVFYLSVCFTSYIFIRFAFDEGAWLALSIILCVWASDIGAYVTGKTIGGPKMAPSLSPNKTWAGLGGSMFFCGLALFILQYLGDLPEIPYVFVVGLFLGIVGQGGDLFISFYKRRVGAKDTGQLIPGHGGILDRIDALLLVSPVFLGVLLLCL